MNDAEPPASLSVLIQNWPSRESEAIERIHRDYFPRLRALSRRTLGGLAGANVEADDVVQSALHSLCRYMRSHPESSGQDRDDIWRLLCHLVACKSRRRVQRQTRGLKGGRVRPVSDLAPTDGTEGIDQLLASVSPTEFDVLLADALEQLDPTLQQITLLAMEGHTREAIAERLGCSRRTVIRKLQLIQRSLEAFAE